MPHNDQDEIKRLQGICKAQAEENKKLRVALISIKKWIMDPFGPQDFNSKSLHPAFLKALKTSLEALKR